MAASGQGADLLVRNARVWTGDAGSPWADSLAVRDGRIVCAGGCEGKARETIDAGGRLVTPGFIDTHIHFIEGGFRLGQVQLRDAGTKAEFVRRIREQAARTPKGRWVLGGDWNHELWGGELPSRAWIDSVTPDNPVWVNRLDGHMSLANSVALRLAGVDKETRDVEGGTIVRDPNGQPTGILKDNARSLLSRIVPESSIEEKLEALDRAMAYVAERGVTSVHHLGTWQDLEALERAHAQGRLRTRIYAAVPLATWERLRDRVKDHGRGDEWLRWGLLKGFMDGSLGSRTAAMDDGFTDQPGDRGLLVNPPEKMEEWIRGADRAGLHVTVHAIGDRANRMLLDIYQRAARDHGSKDRRFRVEHAQHLRPGDIARFGKLGVIASMQPYHVIDDGCWAERVIGKERAKGTYVFRTLLDTGARLAFGSDWFVAPPSVAEGLYAAVTRATLDGKQPGGWVPEQKISAEEALRSYTAEGAYASFEEEFKGTLRVGKAADFAVLSHDVTRVKGEEIRGMKALLTVVGGRVVHRAGL